MHGLILLLIQVGVIVLIARFIGWILHKIQQPQVVGEMLAGIMLGPSFLGWLAPDLFISLFPAQSLAYLNTLSQIGLVLFMFLIGLEIDPKLMRGHGKSVFFVSYSSIIVPFFFGTALAFYLYPKTSSPTVSFTGFTLFMGISMSVTAFPVLARILSERNLLQTKIGAITIACAAIADVTAWGILAGVIVIVRASGTSGLLITIVGSIIYILFMLYVFQPIATVFQSHYESKETISQNILAIILLCIFASAITTEWLGVHALLGSFMLGAVMPKDKRFVMSLSEKIEDLTVVLFLPLFFAYTGLKTKIGLVQGWEMWMDCGLIILVASIGKFGSSSLASKLTGLSWRESGALGVLMNTRGLMELVILTIGLDLGIISQNLFAMMVIMAIFTTFMTTPILELVYPVRFIQQELLLGTDETKFTVVVPIASTSSMGMDLLNMAKELTPNKSQVYALHLINPNQESITQTGPYLQREERKELQVIVENIKSDTFNVSPIIFISRSIGKDICAVAKAKNANLILMGWHKPLLSQSILSGTVYTVMQSAKADVAVYVGRQHGSFQKILIPFIGGVHDLAAVQLAKRIIDGKNIETTILQVVDLNSDTDKYTKELSKLKQSFKSALINLQTVHTKDSQEAMLKEAKLGYDLIIIGVSEAWGLEPTLFGRRHERLSSECNASLLIVRKYTTIEHTREDWTTEDITIS